MNEFYLTFRQQLLVVNEPQTAVRTTELKNQHLTVTGNAVKLGYTGRHTVTLRI